MTTYRPGQVAELLGVSTDTVRRWCDEGRLTTQRSAGGHRTIEGAALARYLAKSEQAYESEGVIGQSARNRFTGIVTSVQRDKLTAIVELRAGSHRLVSLMTREAIDELGLEPGDLAVAVVKATTVIVEVPRELGAVGVFERWRQRLVWDGTQGRPRSSNAASSFHLTWLGTEPEPGRSWVAVAATLEVTAAPTVPALYFWALQASFTDRGRDGGAGHLGLQWHPQHPGSTAVNWGGYDAGGGELGGSAAALPSALDNPNTRDLRWSSGVPYRLAIRRAVPDDEPGPTAPAGTTAWRGEVTDLTSGEVTVVRDLYASGSGLAAPVMWSEVFARCDDPTTAVRWHDLRLTDDAGGQRVIERVRVSYQARADGGCATTDVALDAGGVQQVTGTVRRTRAGAELAVAQPERS